MAKRSSHHAYEINGSFKPNGQVAQLHGHLYRAINHAVTPQTTRLILFSLRGQRDEISLVWKGPTVFYKVCNHVIAVYSENKLQHYATVYRNHKNADEKLGLFRFCKFFMFFFFSANTLQPVQKSRFNWTATRLECSWQAVAYISHVWHWKPLNLCCLLKLFEIFNVY